MIDFTDHKKTTDVYNKEIQLNDSRLTSRLGDKIQMSAIQVDQWNYK